MKKVVKDIFLNLMFSTRKNYMNFIMTYYFYLKGRNLNKVQRLVANLPNKNQYVILIKNFKQSLNIGLTLKKVHRVIKFNQKAWLEPHIKMNIDLRKIAKHDFEKTQILTNKPVYLGLWILDLSKTTMYEVWYDYIKAKYYEKAKLRYLVFYWPCKKRRYLKKILQKILKEDLICQILN